ncbi:MAG: methylated-DNA--[protein]-cysteine S-methyltransferase [Chloroflexi bacterium]|uniref:methylated-DNA--[protein]-cysteine S-methyltransferase n=1 Tax=Candidatus Flexifilum breve TaxID=3140694 RepID=UPI0031359351|nr:methylated-DNA--[protein]-cysteine S-methyltransferase [Chloroflexota bacterium]
MRPSTRTSINRGADAQGARRPFGYEAGHLGEVFQSDAQHHPTSMPRWEGWIAKTSLNTAQRSPTRFTKRARLAQPRVQRRPDRYDAGAYRDGAPCSTIRYTVATCYLGALLIGLTGRGVCAIGIYDDERAAGSALTGGLPAAHLLRDDEALQATVNAILDTVEARAPRSICRWIFKATAFQWRVWDEPRRIPRGKRRTYSEIAAALGNPKRYGRSRRRVAAIAAILIPCHRVISKDGKLTGYKWGVERKRLLLEQEAKQG